MVGQSMVRDSRHQHNIFMDKFCEIATKGIQKVYKCKICSKEMNKITKVKYHVKLAHTNIRDYYCNICNAEFVERYECIRHGNKVHGVSLAEASEKHVIQNNQVVNWEDIEINPENYKDPSKQWFESAKSTRRNPFDTDTDIKRVTGSRQHDIFLERFCRVTLNGKEKVYECKICCKAMTAKVTNLKYHVKSAHTNTRDYLCALCNTGYTERYNCLRHVFRAHEASVTDDSEKYVIRNNEVENWEDIQINTDNWSDHNLPFEKIVQESVDAFELKYAKIHSDGRVQKYECKLCDAYNTENINKLREHVANTHGGPKRYRCKACNVEFFRREGFVGHVSKIHPEHLDVASKMAPKAGEIVMPSSEDHKCLTCGILFSSEFHRTKHHEIVHEGGGSADNAEGATNGSADQDQSVTCEICGMVGTFYFCTCILKK